VVQIIFEDRRAFDLRMKAADVIGKARSTEDAFFFSVFSLVEEFGRRNLQIADFMSDWVELQNCIRGGF
jgi:hypothetical protein